MSGFFVAGHRSVEIPGAVKSALLVNFSSRMVAVRASVSGPPQEVVAPEAVTRNLGAWRNLLAVTSPAEYLRKHTAHYAITINNRMFERNQNMTSDQRPHTERQRHVDIFHKIVQFGMWSC